MHFNVYFKFKLVQTLERDILMCCEFILVNELYLYYIYLFEYFCN